MGGHGFLVAERQDVVLEGEKGVGGALQMPGEPIGRAEACGGGENGRVVADGGGEGGGVDVLLRVTGEPELFGIAGEGPRTGVGVPDPEERIALVLQKEVGTGLRPVVRGAREQGPTGGIGTEPLDEVLGGGGHDMQGFGITVCDIGALGAQELQDGLGPDAGAELGGGLEAYGEVGGPVPVPVGEAPLQHLPYEGLLDACVEGEVQEPRSGDLNAGDPGAVGDPPPQLLGNGARLLAGLPASCRATLVA